MTPDDRAAIVAALRAEADRIEAGGDASLWATNPDHYHETDESSVDLVRGIATPDAVCGEWPEDPPEWAWGVSVTVERAALTAETQTPDGVYDSIQDWHLRPAGYAEPPTRAWVCPWCEARYDGHLSDDAMADIAKRALAVWTSTGPCRPCPVCLPYRDEAWR